MGLKSSIFLVKVLKSLICILNFLWILDNDNKPYQTYVDKGCFRIDEHKYLDKTGAIVTKLRTYCYKYGINLIKKTLEEYAGGKNNG